MKRYKTNISDQFWTISAIKSEMREYGIKEIEATEGKMMTGEPFFYCSKHSIEGSAYDSECGKSCKEYSPRNGKAGRCRFSSNCYEETETKKLIRI